MAKSNSTAEPAPITASAPRIITTLRGDAEQTRPTRGTKRAQQIVDVAEEEFHRQGFAETSMDDIAQAVGILKGSLYYYIDTKDDLLYLIASSVHDIVDKKTAEAIAREDLSPLERIAHFVESQVDYNARNVVRIAVYHHEWHRLSGVQLEEIRHRRHDNGVALRGLLEQARATAEIPEDTDIELALNNVLAIAIWPYTWYRQGGRVSPEQLAASCRDFVYRALLSR